MRRLSPVNRVRAVTAGVAGAIMAVVVVGLFATATTSSLGFLPFMGPLLLAATVVVAAWRAEGAITARSALGWAWGSAWRSWLVAALVSGIILGVMIARSAPFWPPPGAEIGFPSAEDIGIQAGLTVAVLYAPWPLLLGLVAHLAAALTVRRAVRRSWRWFAA
jgi:hypothetical protein